MLSSSKYLYYVLYNREFRQTCILIGERARHSQVCTIENRGYILYIMVRAISVYSAGMPYAARFTAAVKIPLTLGYVSVLEFVSIESYLKAISSDYGSNKEY